MAPELEHPDISRALKYGRGRSFEHEQLCAECGEDIGDWAYETEPNHFICAECFRETVRELLNTSPRELASALSVPYRYMA